MAGTFDGLRYIAGYPDLIRAFGADAQAGADHQNRMGQSEGRYPRTLDPFCYAAAYADLIIAIGADGQH